MGTFRLLYASTSRARRSAESPHLTTCGDVAAGWMFAPVCVQKRPGWRRRAARVPGPFQQSERRLLAAAVAAQATGWASPCQAQVAWSRSKAHQKYAKFFMELTTTRQRVWREPVPGHSLLNQMIILLRSHKEMKIVCTNVGFAMRCVVLCDLSMNKLIELGPDDTVRAVRTSDGVIEREFLYRIGQCHYGARQLLRALNGELSKDFAIKNLRSRAYKELEGRGIIKIEKTLIYKKIILSNMDVWAKVHNRLVAECRAGKLSTESKVLLVALNYTNRMESVLLQCSEPDAVSVTNCFTDLRQKISAKQYTAKERLIFSILEGLVK